MYKNLTKDDLELIKKHINKRFEQIKDESKYILSS